MLTHKAMFLGCFACGLRGLLDPLYEVWETGKSVEPSSLLKKAIESLNAHWTGVGSPSRIKGAA
ncbi:hypothetical protein LTEGF4_26360 (plasmid) [Limnohabitans sp. TEGF004]|jgi:hypothetical protein|nr:hypothetical protein LTEGF4_26360 [Limnohabitans sp. TEGF004]